MSSKRPFKKKGKRNAAIWGVTLLAAFAIIGLSVYVARNQSAPPQPAPADRPASEQKALPPGTQTAQGRPEIARPDPEQTPSMPAPEMGQEGPAKIIPDNLAGTLKLMVPFLEERNKIPLDHTCFRRNVSPSFSWKGVPPGTRTFVVFFEKREGEADAFVNWIVFDIPGGEIEFAENMPHQEILPNGGKLARSDHNNIGYIGPCETKGRYTYALRIFALDTVLGLTPGVDKDTLIRAMNGHIIDAAEQEFTHYYKL